MIRLAVSDMDGCLLNPDGTLPDDFREVLDLMEKKHCVFAAASGRGQRGIEIPIKDDMKRIAGISDNGSFVVYQGKKLFLTTPDPKLLIPVIEEARRHPGVVPILCAAKNTYLASNTVLDDRTVTELKKYYPSWKLLDDLTCFPEPIIKVSLLCFDDIEKNIYPYFKHFNGPITVKVTAYVWIDVFDPSASKGAGVHEIQKTLGISKNETIVFGDYLNDISMKDYAIRSYAVGNAHPDVKEAFTDVIGSNREDSVLNTIRDYMNRQ